MGFWEQYNRLTIGIWLAVFVAAIFLYPVGVIVHEKYFKKESLFQCEVSQSAPNGTILIVKKEELMHRWDSLSYLRLGYADTTHLRMGNLLIIAAISKDSTFAKIHYRGGWKGNTEFTGFTRLENLECWPLVQAR